MSKSNIDLSIITVAFNSQNEISNWVESIVETVKKHSFEMIISDNSQNHETEEVVKELQKKYKNLHYVFNNANLGFSKGNNVGVKLSKGEFILFLNPDVEVEENTIDELLEYLKTHADVGAVTPAVFLPNGKLDDSCHRGFPTPWRSLCYFSKLSKVFPKSRLFAGYNLTYLDFSKTHEIDSLAGSFLLISRKLGDRLGWWDEDYFFYGEDIDFCYRIKKEGLKILFVPEYKALHHKGLSSGIKDVSKQRSQASLETKRWATNHRFNAMEIFYNKHYKKKYPKIVNAAVLWAVKWKRNMALKNISK